MLAAWIRAPLLRYAERIEQDREIRPAFDCVVPRTATLDPIIGFHVADFAHLIAHKSLV